MAGAAYVKGNEAAPHGSLQTLSPSVALGGATPAVAASLRAVVGVSKEKHFYKYRRVLIHNCDSDVNSAAMTVSWYRLLLWMERLAI